MWAQTQGLTPCDTFQSTIFIWVWQFKMCITFQFHYLRECGIWIWGWKVQGKVKTWTCTILTKWTFHVFSGLKHSILVILQNMTSSTCTACMPRNFREMRWRWRKVPKTIQLSGWKPYMLCGSSRSPHKTVINHLNLPIQALTLHSRNILVIRNNQHTLYDNIRREAWLHQFTGYMETSS